MISRSHTRKDARRDMPRPRGAVRIISGQWKRTRLPVLDVAGLRPTPDRVRETLFSWLTHLFGGSIAGCSVLDLFAGTGALGLEAASRGAEPVVLVDRNPAVLASLRTISDKLNAVQVEVRSGDGIAVARHSIEIGERFSIVFLDPPFGEDWLVRLLPLAFELCESHGFIYAESESRLEPLMLADCGLQLVRADKAGGVFYHLLRRTNNE